MLQQRVLSLQILSRIIHRARQREYEDLVVESLVKRLCEAEVPLLLRYALDEGTEAVVTAAVQALHSLLVTTTDQVCKQVWTCLLFKRVNPAFPGFHYGGWVGGLG